MEMNMEAEEEFMNGEDEIEPVMKGAKKRSHKYIVAHNIQPLGNKLYINKCCAAVFLLSIILAMLLIFLLTYFLLGNSCAQTEEIVKNGLSSFQTKSTKQDDEISFPEGWYPIHYEIVMEPNITSSKSNGTVDIWVMRDSSVTELMPVVLDITEINITSCKVFRVDKADIEEHLEYDCKYGAGSKSYIIEMKATRHQLTNVSIQLEFESELTSTLNGFYKGSYTDSETKEESWFVSTQFSPIDARRAFPCFDNPEMKATFKFSIIRPAAKTTSLSNMPVLESTPVREGYVKEDFGTSPKMSTYLVAFHVSDLVIAHESPSKNSHNIKVWTRKELKNLTDYGYELTTKSLPFFEDYFGIRFRLPKIDLVAVPDFGFNAMENWGLITFRESAFLVNTSPQIIPSAKHMKSVARTLVHEVAHQWFGNLVTMTYYDYLWLKEGFATYLSYVAVEKIKPEWKHFSTFTLSEVNDAMKKDSDVLSHAICFPVRTQSDIRRIFDPISYSKGASLINMMRGFLGESTFREGLKMFLKKFEYANAAQDDLWNVMTEQAHNDGVLGDNTTIKEIMDPWTLQPGYPVVTLKRDGNNVIITQERFMLPNKLANDTTKWTVPISLATNTRVPHTEIPEFWLKDSDESLVIENIVTPDEYIFLNINRTGYYRTNYDEESWKKLIQKFTELPSITRAQLLDDSFNLARAKLIEYDIPLTLFLAAGKLPLDDLMWWAISNSLEDITNIIRREPLYEIYRGVIKSIVNIPYTEIGFDENESESHTQLLHRSRIIELACKFGVDRCVNKAQIMFREWMTDSLPLGLPENLKETVSCQAIEEGSSPEWNFAYEKYLQSSSTSEKEILLKALGCTTKPWILSKYLTMIVSNTSGIRKQDGVRAFSSVAANSVGTEIAFDFMYSNLAEIAEYFGEGFSTLSKMIDALATRMNKEIHKNHFEMFAEKAKKLGLNAVEKSIKLAGIEIDKNIFWMENSYEAFKKLLQQMVERFHFNIS